MKTASRILGSAFFAEGFEVQDAPRYGAERRGAPIFATVRAAHRPIHERGAIARPDLVVVADETLVPVAAAGVLAGISPETVLLLRSDVPAATWTERLNLRGAVIALPASGEAELEAAHLRFVGAACAGAAARLLGVISRPALEGAVREELDQMEGSVLSENLSRALDAYDALEEHAGCVRERSETGAADAEPPGWIDLPFDDARISAPDVHATATSVQVRTGLWRTMRPVIDLDHCHRCHWVCSTFCPDGAVLVEEGGTPRIDYDHCKGCLVCVAVCPPHAIRAEPEARFREAEEGR